ncbi:DUF2442 domain-containing protein [Massilia solisilvae]|uniref:DUF2442 domain-containing protein n=1 Tax=Massilia solisilvae TaxID=1811225 RepID=A0ABT2BLQ1_9BURK|nr:DUF2442 domain-containing protein [Massilia solisilvae]MCS0609445.1 DUF2442 domain-containing protein [Massilia solisilvae]
MAICVTHPEVTIINRRGFWLELRGEELYLPFLEFPEFEHASIAQVCQVECLGARLYWPLLHIDLPLQSLRNPLVSRRKRDVFNC